MTARELVRSGTATMAPVLLTFWSVGQLWTWWDPPLGALVFAVMLAIGLPRAITAIPDRDWPSAGLAMLAGVTVAVGCAMLLAGELPQFVAGVAAFAAAAASAVWLRGLGPRWRAGGIAAGVPFTAILVQPFPLERTWSELGWMVCAAAVALAWTLALALLAGAAPIAPPSREAPRSGRSSETKPRLTPSARQAVQLLVALVVTFALARLIDPDHLVWPVLTVLLVSSGNLGRGDVTWKGAQRTAGAIVGTMIATWLAAGLDAGDSRGLVAMFAVLGIAAILRPLSYAYWTAGITAALAFLYGYVGQSGADLLGQRLLGIAAGSAAAILAAWFILPIRARDVRRRRLADALATASTVLAELYDGTKPPPSITLLMSAKRDLYRLLPATRAAELVLRGTHRRDLGELEEAVKLIAQVEQYAAGPSDSRTEARMERTSRDIGIARRRLATSKPNRSGAGSD